MLMEDANLDLTALLLQVANERSKSAYSQLFHYFAPRIRHYGLRHLRSDARAMELVQDTLLAVWQKAALYHPEKGAPTTWIYTVMRNQCFDILRRQQVSKEDLVAEDIWPVLEYQSVQDDDNDPGENDILTRQLTHYLHLLPSAQQEVVRSVYLQDQTLQEIADRLQIPLGTVKSRLRLGLSKLREQIEQEHEYD
jgi:RNA polymerase sigma-70 factor, ECF subfamily